MRDICRGKKQVKSKKLKSKAIKDEKIDDCPHLCYLITIFLRDNNSMDYNKTFKTFKDSRKRGDYNNLLGIARDLGIPVPSDFLTKNGVTADTGRIISEIYNRLQTEIMIHTVKNAKWSCFWAAVAAIGSFAAMVLMLLPYLRNLRN